MSRELKDMSDKEIAILVIGTEFELSLCEEGEELPPDSLTKAELESMLEELRIEVARRFLH